MLTEHDRYTVRKDAKRAEKMQKEPYYGRKTGSAI